MLTLKMINCICQGTGTKELQNDILASHFEKAPGGFPGGPVVGDGLPASAGDTCSIPVQGGSHRPPGN